MEITTSIEEPKKRNIGGILKWAGFGFVCLIFFTFVKTPTYQLEATIQDQIVAAGRGAGLTSITSSESDLSLFLTPSYSMEGVRMSFRDASAPLKIDSIKAKPHILKLLTGGVGASLSLEKAGGDVDASFAQSGKDVSLALGISDVDLFKWQPKVLLEASGAARGNGAFIVGMLDSITGKLVLDGDVDFDGNPTQMADANGEIDLKLKEVALSELNLMGFKVPPMKIKSGDIKINLLAGKATLNKVEIGKKGRDDFWAKLTGSITFKNRFNSGQAKIKARFGLSEKMLTSLGLVKNLLRSADQGDGSYLFEANGRVSALGNAFRPVPKK